MIIEIIALFCCGIFFGAALYISLAQHPAMLDAGVTVGAPFFPLMYHRAAPMQIILAIAGFVNGALLWYLEANIIWLIGALFLISVVPITLIFIKPVNDILLNPDNNLDPERVQAVLIKWGPRHWVRTLMSGIAFLLYLYAGVS